MRRSNASVVVLCVLRLTSSRRMLPLISENNVVSLLHGSLAAKLATTTQALSIAEQGNIAANERNRDLSKSLLALTDRIGSQSVEDIEDPHLREKVQAVEKELRESRRRMRNLKGILSGMIVGSGIDWAEDEVLCELVMDDEDEG
jgi:hypothetical protein